MKRFIPLLIAAAFALALAGSAGAAGVLVYKNEFKNRQDFKQIQKFEGGKACGKSWKGKKTLGVSANGAREDCVLTTPVEGDGNQPDYTIQAVGKVLKKTDKKVRSSTYVGLAVRANKRASYEMRIFPKGRKWQLIKNGNKIAGGKEKAIEALNKKNKLRLDVEKSTVLARVNGAKLAKFKDEDPEQVKGRKTAVTFGNTSNKKKKALGLFDGIRILVPDPSS